VDSTRMTVVEASAGTGKTYSLVTRLVSLMAGPGGAEPENIVALTFTRAAAGEIFDRFIQRLASAAESEEAARRESVEIGASPPLGAGDFAELLRKTISRQHLSQIGTIDGFLLRMLKAAPLEAGLSASAEIMPEHRTPAEKRAALDNVFSLGKAAFLRDSGGEGGDEVFDFISGVFELIFGSKGSKSFVGEFSAFVDRWNKEFCARPRPEEWGDPATIWPGGAPAAINAGRQEIRELAASIGPEPGTMAKRGVASFVEKVAEWRGGEAPKIPAALKEDPAAAKAVFLMRMSAIGAALRKTQGIFRLMAMYESVYLAGTRSRGRIVFDDVPRLIARMEPGARAALEYRLDGRYVHWAIDEFQDTSPEQWRAIRNLVEERAMSQDGGSVFIVGDMKQSIYGWRGGDSALLAARIREAESSGTLSTLDESHRFGPAIAEAVNRIFREGNVCGAAGFADVEWRFRDHKAHDPDAIGFVQIVQAEKSGSTPCIEDFFDPVANCIKAARPREYGHETAVLVRKNEHGVKMAAHLKSLGMDVVFEGAGGVLDTPVLEVFLDAARLAAHPGDARAYEHLAQSPLGPAVGAVPGKADSLAPSVSASLLAAFTKLGVERELRALRDALGDAPGVWNDFTQARFDDLVGCAKEFDRVREPAEGLDAFADFAASVKRPGRAAPGAVRVMTIHHSKGLSIDHVIVPLCEPHGVEAARAGSALENDDPPWLMVHPGGANALADGTLAKAENRRIRAAAADALCAAYVAATRAKTALTIILNPLSKNEAGGGSAGGAVRISNLVRSSGVETSGEREWAKKLAERRREKAERGRPAADAARPEPQAERGAAFVRKPREPLAKSRPSDSFLPGMKAGFLFSEDYGSAARRGELLHGKYAAVEWIENPATPFEAALAKPSPDATLWRERKYEYFDGGRWETGVFDRVVFTGGGGARRAKVIDFKTNAVREGETREAFEARLARTYAAQMAAYRRAVSALTGIPACRVDASILAEATASEIVLPQ